LSDEGVDGRMKTIEEIKVLDTPDGDILVSILTKQ
jgi:hypothetical protein